MLDYDWLMQVMTDKTKERFKADVTKVVDSDCWHYWGPCSHNGNPRFTVGGRNYCARTIAYYLFVGVTPPGRFVVTTCKMRCCMNPEHLMAVSGGENRRWYGS